jgi:hypothetical protein
MTVPDTRYGSATWKRATRRQRCRIKAREDLFFDPNKCEAASRKTDTSKRDATAALASQALGIPLTATPRADAPRVRPC